MKKIYTIRDISQQQAYMWNRVSVEDEVTVCRERRLDRYLLKYLHKGEPILEAGCGPGTWVIYLREMGFDVQGMEHDEVLVSRIKKDMPDIPVRVGDIAHLPHKDGALGGYISLGVVEHFINGADAPLNEAFRVLRPGGIMILTVPYNNIFRKLVAHPLRSLYLSVYKLQGGKTHFAEYRYSLAEVCDMINKAGFEIIETGTDDYSDSFRSMLIWSEFPMLRHKTKPHDLNIIGRLTALFFNSISKTILAAGILVVAKKPEQPQGKEKSATCAV